MLSVFDLLILLLFNICVLPAVLCFIVLFIYVLIYIN